MHVGCTAAFLRAVQLFQLIFTVIIVIRDIDAGIGIGRTNLFYMSAANYDDDFRCGANEVLPVEETAGEHLLFNMGCKLPTPQVLDAEIINSAVKARDMFAEVPFEQQRISNPVA